MFDMKLGLQQGFKEGDILSIQRVLVFELGTHTGVTTGNSKCNPVEILTIIILVYGRFPDKEFRDIGSLLNRIIQLVVALYELSLQNKHLPEKFGDQSAGPHLLVFGAEQILIHIACNHVHFLDPVIILGVHFQARPGFKFLLCHCFI